MIDSTALVPVHLRPKLPSLIIAWSSKGIPQPRPTHRSKACESDHQEENRFESTTGHSIRLHREVKLVKFGTEVLGGLLRGLETYSLTGSPPLQLLSTRSLV